MSFQFFDKLLTTHRILALARELHAQYVFSIVHGHETYIGDEAASVGRQLNIPSVFTLHGLYSYHRQLFGLKVVRRAVSNMNATDRLIAVSHLAAKSYQSQGVLRGFEIIPNGITPPAKSGRANPPLDIVAFIKQKFVILTVGFFAVEKRVDFSVKTLARLHRIGMDNAVLIIIGKGRRDEEAELRKLIDQEEVTDFVRIVGEVKPADMTTYYSIADVLLHPSIIESFSMVCLEAMSHGKPIICTSNIGLVEFLHLGKDSIVVPPDDLDAMFQAVLHLIKKPSLRRRIGQQARQTATALSWTNQIRKIERMYEDLLAA
jgi:glycosyltransferase involved in cell wall biosynthesis